MNSRTAAGRRPPGSGRSPAAPGRAAGRRPADWRSTSRPRCAPDAVHDHAQRAGGGDLRVLLPERSGRGVAGVGERRLALLDQPALSSRTPRPGSRPRHAPREFGESVVRPVSCCGTFADGADVGGDVLPRVAVAAGGGADQPAALVDEVDGEAVDLQLAQVVRAGARRPARRARPRRTSSSLAKALSRLCIRSRCSTAGSGREAAVTFWLGESGVTSAGCAASIVLARPSARRTGRR